MKVWLFVVLSTFCFNAQAWGPIGHRIVGQIAAKHLDGRAKREVKELLGNETLAISSTWADFIKSDRSWDKANTWHYVTIEDGQTYETSTINPQGDVVEAIDRMIKTLKNKKAERQERINALKFLVHFVGDIHQPFHVGRGNDRGGNNIRVRWFDRDSNMHALWDEDLINYQQLSYTEYAAMLEQASKEQIKQWQSDDINVWIKDNMQLRPLIYAIGDGKLGYDYNFKVVKAMNLQLQKAGIRLAGVLNQIF